MSAEREDDAVRVKQFTNAKSISSDAFFGRDEDDNNQPDQVSPSIFKVIMPLEVNTTVTGRPQKAVCGAAWLEGTRR